MEELKKLADILEDVKTKISDEEYKQILETSHKIHKKQERQYVKCVIHQVEQYTYMKDDMDGTQCVFSNSDGFTFERGDCVDEALEIFIETHNKMETYIFEVEPNCNVQADFGCQCHEFDMKNKTMNINFYDTLKADKIRIGHSGLGGTAIVFIKDM
jgi:hypothetical protein